MRGSAGASRVEVNAYGRVIRELGKEPARRARMSVSPSTAKCSNSSSQRLGDESAACVVMDVQTGDVIALSSTPGYDPNCSMSAFTSAQWHDLTTDDHKPLINKVMGGVYPPGSTFKPAVALAAVEAGMATPDYHVICNGA